MILKIIYVICVILVSIAAGTFTSFAISKLGKINAKTDSIPKRHWSMGVFMYDIPQTEENTLRLSSVPLKIYGKGEYSELLVPRKGDEIIGVYYSGKKSGFEMTGIVDNVCYNTNIDWIVVECKCIDIRKKSN